MSRLILPSLLILAFGLAMPSPLAAKDDDDKLRKVQTEMLWQKKRAADLEEQGREAAGNLKGLQKKLVEATRALQDKQEEQQQVQERMRGLEKEIAAKNATIAKSRHELAVLAGVLIRLGQQPPETYFLRAGLTDQHIHRAILARSLLPKLQADSEGAARDLAVLNDLRWMAQEQKRLVAAAEKNLKSQQANLDQLVQARQGLLNRTEAQKQAISKQLVALTSQARDLRQLLARVAPPSRKPKGNNAVYRYELDKPVVGTVVRNFGAKDADGIVSRGLTFKSLPSTPVVAPAPGRVVFAGPFRGYGQILILQHKGGYHSFLAGFGRIDAEMGQDVVAGEPLGVLPVKNLTEKPELYFEWRRNGEPVDPMEQKFRVKPASP